MDRATDLRRLADLCNRMAEIPTSGGHSADRWLLTLAEKLRREAAFLNDQTAPLPVSRRAGNAKNSDPSLTEPVAVTGVSHRRGQSMQWRRHA